MRKRHVALAAMAAASLLSAASTASAIVEIHVGMSGQPPGVPSSDQGTDPVAVSVRFVSAPGNILGYGVGAAAGDLTTGTARIYSYGENGFPTATVALSDTITLVGPAPAEVILHVDADGQLFATSTAGGMSSGANLIIGLGQSTKGAEMQHVFTPGTKDHPAQDLYVANPATPTDDETVVAGAEGSFAHVTVRATLTPGVPTDLRVSLAAVFPQNCHGCVETVNFGNTARLSITVPAGYSWTSGSGVLLSQPGGEGLEIPPDGGVGTHGAGSGSVADGGGASSGGPNGTTTPGGADGGAGVTSGSGDAGGCSAGAAGGFGGATAVLFAAFAAFRLRRRRLS